MVVQQSNRIWIDSKKEETLLAGQVNEVWIGVHAEGKMKERMMNDFEKESIRVMVNENADKQKREERRSEEEERIARLLVDQCEVAAVNKVELMMMMMI